MSAHPTAIQRYQVVRRLAQGGMGALYLAWDPALKRQVAIKLLMHDEDELRERFAREAQSAASLDHPNIVTIYDVGEVDGRPFIAMEYIRGETLAEVIRNKAPMNVSRKLALIEELCAGLFYAHKAGIVHRDVKPSNAIVDTQGSLKVLDFGIARLAESSGMTKAGTLVGTLNYISPEQMVGQPADNRSDIFSVGAVCYELLAYRQAFPGGIESGVLNRILQGKPDPLDALCPDLDPEIVRIVERALEKQPQDRYQSLDTMEEDLMRVRLRLDAPKVELVENTKTMILPRSFDSEGLARRRASQIQTHLDAARRAVDAGEFESAVVHSEEVLLLDAEQREAIEIMDRAREALDERQAEEWLNEADTRFRVGALSAAQALIEQALALSPGSQRALTMRGTVEEAVRERGRAKQRADAIKSALDRAHAHFDEGLFQEAIAASSEVLALDPTISEAELVKSRATEALHAREREATDRRAREAVREANRLFSQGNHTQALDLLTRFEPAHETVSNAAASLRAEADRLAEERRLEAERRAREVRLSRELSAIKADIGRAEFTSALDRLVRLEQNEGSTPDTAGLRREAEGGLAREKAAALAREIDQILRSAETLLERRDFDEAWNRTENALRLDAGHPGASALKQKIQSARKAESERREAEKRELARQEAERIATAKREAERQEAEKRAAAQREAERQEAERRAAAKKEAERQEAARREMERQDAARREAERREMEDRAAAALRQAERVAAIRQEAERRQSLLKNESASSADAATTSDDATRVHRPDPSDFPNAGADEFWSEQTARLKLPVPPVPSPLQATPPPPPASAEPTPLVPQFPVTSAKSPTPTGTNLPRIFADPRWVGGAAAVLILAIAIGYFTLRRGEPPVTPPESTPDTAQVEPAAPPPSPPPSNDTVLIQAEQQLANGLLRDALASTATAPNAGADDPKVIDLVDRILKAARASLDQSRQSARKAGSGRPLMSNRNYAEAERRRQESDKLERQGNRRAAAESALTALDLYARAEGEFVAAAQQKAPTTPDSVQAARGDPTPNTRPTSGSTSPGTPTAAPEPSRGAPPTGTPTPGTPAGTSPPVNPTPPATAPTGQASGNQPPIGPPPAPPVVSGTNPPSGTAPVAPSGGAPTEPAGRSGSPPNTGVPVRPQRETEEVAVREILRQYGLAYSNRNVNAVKQLQPSVDENALKRSFDAARRQDADVGITGIDMQAPFTEAVVTGTWTVRVETRIGGRTEQTVRPIRLTLRKSGNTWVITRRE